MSMSRPNTCELHWYCNELRRREKFSDVIIKVENRAFPCHRIILASAVEYFRSMFSGNYNEATQKEVEIKGVKADDFELLLTHIYGGSVNFDDFEGDNAFRLLRICNYVGLDALSNLCEEYIAKTKETIPFSSVLDVYVYASKLGKANLANEFLKRLAQNFFTVAKEEKLHWISRAELDKILSHVDLVKNRMAILDFLEYWTTFHPAEVNVIDQLLIKWNLPSDMCEWFMNKLRKNIMTSNSEDENEAGNTRGTVDKGEERIFYSESMDYDESSVTQPGKIKSPKISLYCRQRQESNTPNGIIDYTHTYHQLKFNTKSNCIEADERILFSIYENSPFIMFLKSVWIEGTQLVLGCRLEYSKFKIFPCVLYESPALGEKLLAVHECSAINSSSQVAVCGTNIYLYNDGEFLMFNPEVNQWTCLTENQPLRTTTANMVSYQNNLYILGGKCVEKNAETMRTTNESKKFHALENGRIFQRYDPREGTWSRLPYMTHCRSSTFSSCVHNGVLYAASGENVSYYNKIVECYDFKACKWREFEEKMPESKYNPIVIGHSDQLYFLGRGYSFTWYWYDLKENVWSDVYSIPNTYHSCKIVEILDAEIMN